MNRFQNFQAVKVVDADSIHAGRCGTVRSTETTPEPTDDNPAPLAVVEVMLDADDTGRDAEPVSMSLDSLAAL